MKEQKRNLLEKYLYEFSQWEKTDVNEEGLYGYEYLDCDSKKNTDKIIIIGIVAISVLIFYCGGNSNDRY